MDFKRIKKEEEITPGYYIGLGQNEELDSRKVSKSLVLYKVDRVVLLGAVCGKSLSQKDKKVAIGQYVFHNENITPLDGAVFFLEDYGIRENPYNNHKLFRVEIEEGISSQEIHKAVWKEISEISYGDFNNLYNK